MTYSEIIENYKKRFEDLISKYIKYDFFKLDEANEEFEDLFKDYRSEIYKVFLDKNKNKITIDNESIFDELFNFWDKMKRFKDYSIEFLICHFNNQG